MWPSVLERPERSWGFENEQSHSEDRVGWITADALLTICEPDQAFAGGFVYDIFIRDIHRRQTMLQVEQQLSQRSRKG